MATVAPAQLIGAPRPSSAGDGLVGILNYSARNTAMKEEKEKAERLSQAMIAILEQTKSPAEKPLSLGTGYELPTIPENNPTQDVPDKVKAATILHRMVPTLTSTEMGQVTTYLDNVFDERRKVKEQVAAEKAAKASGIDVSLGKEPLAQGTQTALIGNAAVRSREKEERDLKIKAGDALLKLIPDPQVRANLQGQGIDTVRPILQDMLVTKRQEAAASAADKRQELRLAAQADMLEKRLVASDLALEKRLGQQAEQFEKRLAAKEGGNQFDQAVTATLERLQAADPAVTRQDAVMVERNRKSLEDGLSKEFGKQLSGGLFEIMENQKFPHAIATKMSERLLAKGGTVGEAISESARRARVAVQQGQIIPDSVWRMNNELAVKGYLLEVHGVSKSVADEYVSEWKRSGIYQRKINAAIGTGR